MHLCEIKPKLPTLSNLRKSFDMAEVTTRDGDLIEPEQQDKPIKKTRHVSHEPKVSQPVEPRYFSNNKDEKIGKTGLPKR